MPHPSRRPPVILVTGASSGFGAAIATRLAREGCRVYGTSRRAPAIAPPSPSAGDPYPRMLPLDVRDDGSVFRAVTAICEGEGRIDAVVNNAGIGIAGAIEDTTPSELWQQLETNLVGVLRVCRAVLPIMRRQGGGRIVNIGSLAGVVALPFQGAYSASKFALEGLTEALRMETRPFGIHVSLLEPGDFKTDFTRNRIRTAATRAGSVYGARLEAALGIMERDERNGPDPAGVAALVARVLATPSPRLRYTAGRPLQRAAAVLKRLVPAGVFEWLLTRTYGLR
jgi:NAD(P)-dependent dehydrogenase (short-subunit alcohol dehydrogenase family)